MLLCKEFWLLFLLLIGLDVSVSVTHDGVSKKFTPIEAQNILFSQTGLKSSTHDGTSLIQLSNNMKTTGFNPDYPIGVVEMKKGIFTSLDNRRLAAGQAAGVGIDAIVHQPESKLPNSDLGRFGNSQNYGDAVKQRMRTGSFDATSVQQSQALGFNSQDVRIRNIPHEQRKVYASTFSQHDLSSHRRDGMYKPSDTFTQTLPKLQENKLVNMDDESQFPSLGGSKKSTPVQTSSHWGKKPEGVQSPSSEGTTSQTRSGTGIGSGPSAWGLNTGSPSLSRRGSIGDGLIATSINRPKSPSGSGSLGLGSGSMGLNPGSLSLSRRGSIGDGFSGTIMNRPPSPKLQPLSNFGSSTIVKTPSGSGPLGLGSGTTGSLSNLLKPLSPSSSSSHIPSTSSWSKPLTSTNLLTTNVNTPSSSGHGPSSSTQKRGGGFFGPASGSWSKMPTQIGYGTEFKPSAGSGSVGGGGQQSSRGSSTGTKPRNMGTRGGSGRGKG